MRRMESPARLRLAQRLALVLASFCLLAAAGAAAAPAAIPEVGPLEITLGGGATLPQGHFSDRIEGGSVLFAGLGWRMLPPLVLGGEVAWHRFEPGRALVADFPESDLEFSILQWAGSGKLVFGPGRARFYLRGLVGQYETRFEVEQRDKETVERDRQLGYAIGAGVQIMGEDEAALCFEGLWHRIPGDEGSGEKNLDFITVGASMLFFGP